MFPHDPPKTKEGYYYRKVFEKLFGHSDACQGLRESVRAWKPKWCDTEDPSGRAQKVHIATTVSSPKLPELESSSPTSAVAV